MVHITLKSIAIEIAFFPYTTECSPERMTFPGAENLRLFILIKFLHNNEFIRKIIIFFNIIYFNTHIHIKYSL